MNSRSSENMTKATDRQRWDVGCSLLETPQDDNERSSQRLLGPSNVMVSKSQILFVSSLCALRDGHSV